MQTVGRTTVRCAKVFGLAAVIGGFFSAQVCRSQMRVLVDQVGYETHAPKQAIVAGSAKDRPEKFALIDTDSGKTVLTAELKPAGKVYAWPDQVFWTADFSAWQKTGNYSLRVDAGGAVATSCAFEINDDILERETLSNVVFYF